MFRRLIGALRRPSKYSLGALLIGGIGFGVAALASFNYIVDYTNSLEFCISCHEMRDTVYQEYMKSDHYQNESGVRAICSDCHVPHTSWFATTWRKFKASNELIHKVLGTVDTPAKFEAHRLELAQHVWKTMKETNSQTCRKCHSFEAMDFHAQDKRAARKMEQGWKEGKTCIDCHRGVVHHLPKGYEKPKT